MCGAITSDGTCRLSSFSVLKVTAHTAPSRLRITSADVPPKRPSCQSHSLGNSGLHMPAVRVVGGQLDTVRSIAGFRWTCEYLLDRFCVQSSQTSRHFQ